MIFGKSLEGVVLPAKSTIEDMLEGNISIEFLILDPVWASSAKLNKAIAIRDIEDGIGRSLNVLCDIEKELGASKKDRCKIKTYQIQPTYSGIVIDPEAPEAVILVELNLYYTDANSRPVIVIRKKENEAFFEKWWRSFDKVSQNAKEYVCSKKDLLKTDALNVEPKKSIGKVEEISPLIEVYSPIHAMIVRVNKEIPRETALQLTVGAWVKASLIDSGNISAVFNQHNDKLRNRDLEMWLEIEKEIKEEKGFFLGKDRQKWFDELEAEYNRLTKH
jgi:hypothetical protein